jgi:hypothetical protein
VSGRRAVVAEGGTRGRIWHEEEDVGQGSRARHIDRATLMEQGGDNEVEERKEIILGLIRRLSVLMNGNNETQITPRKRKIFLFTIDIH